MNQRRKLLLRTAERIRERLRAIRAPASLCALPEENWNRCSELARQFSLAHNRGWQQAAMIVRDRYRSAFNRLIEQTRELQSQLYESESAATPSLRQIADELFALDQEFDSLRIDTEECLLAVTTDRLVLDDVDLGPFEIRLYWNRIGRRHSYETVALQPNPACGDEDVTHPHIRSNVLCEGDGKPAIDRALREGRFYDFFSIVTQVLHTYSAASPYVPLEQWSGITCSDCGSVTDDEESTRCTRCSDALCLDCRTYCERCECDFCQECIGSCRICDAALCRDCQTACTGCGKGCCSGCLSDSEFCEECQNDQESEPDDLSTSDSEVIADPPTAPASAGAATEAGASAVTSL